MQNEPVIKKVDFPDRDIFITVDSEVELRFRANACAKEPFTAEWIKSTAYKGVFYDIGANVGSYSLIAASLMSDDNSVVVAFEPVYFNFYKLCENSIINKLSSRIIPLNVALTQDNKMMEMHISNSDFGSTQGFDTKEAQYCVKVLCASLDQMVESFGLPFPNHIKIDVDGSEKDVIEGGRKVFYDSRLQSVMIEVNEENIKEASVIYNYFDDAGFDIQQRYPLMTKNYYNVLYIRRKDVETK